MYYSDELVEEIRQRCSIVDLVSGYVSLKKKGSNYFGLCPFHNEKSASFSVNEEKQMYHCFGCGVSGNAYTFLMQMENFSFPEAIRFLAEKEGVPLPEESGGGEIGQKQRRLKALLAVNKDAATYFYYALRDPSGARGMEYFQKRELTSETMQHWGLGYAAKNSNAVIAYLRSKGHSDEMIQAAGLADFSEKYGLSGKFWNRVMFPIMDVRGKVIGFGGRVMGDGEPKYLNSPETEVFNKSQNLYGLNYARTSRKDHLILCEGYMDVIAMHQAGFTQAVASLGTAFTQKQAQVIKKYTQNVILSYDSDAAGVKAALRALGILRETGLSGRVLDLKPYKDPDEFMKNLGKEEFQKRLDQAENGFLFEIAILAGSHNLSDPDQKTRFHNAVAQKLCGFTQEMERENYLEKVAQQYDIQPDILRNAVRGYAKAGLTEDSDRRVYEKPRTLPAAARKEQRREEKLIRSMKLVLGVLYEHPALYQQLRGYLKKEEFGIPPFDRAAGIIFEELEKDEQRPPAALISFFTDEEEQRVVGEIFHAKEDARGSISRAGDAPESADREAFREALLYVKNSAFDAFSKTAPITEVMAYKNDLEQLGRIRLDM